MNDQSNHLKNAFKAAFPNTLPILTGFLFLGIAYGIFMTSLGFSPVFPILMSIFIFAGSMEFVTANLLLGTFNPIGAFILTLMVNARHLFYGLSMLDKYQSAGKISPYLIFGMCDESFSINLSASIPNDVEPGRFYFFVTLLNHIYWVAGATIGALFGSLLPFYPKGLDFVMTALLVVIFLDQWLKEDDHQSALIGMGLTLASLLIFGSNRFVVPAMIAILGVLIPLSHQKEGLKE
ncbi:AzlC family ABC transporter permease [Eubacteriaceae bacterium ES3]|nr:AzlC family ABC transporter permease [Eubacteriaceae bacterium ES3]